MIDQVCQADDRDYLLALLENEPVSNIFMLADIDLYGFDHDFQRIWRSPEGQAEAVYLLFYDNLSLWARSPGDIDRDFVLQIVSHYPVCCIMGKYDSVAPLHLLFPDLTMSRKNMCALHQPVKKVVSQDLTVAGPADVEAIFRFLSTFPQLRALYTSQQMIADRIDRRDGIHLILREGEEILAHGNTTASTDRAIMVGGIGAKSLADAEAITARLCQGIQAEDKIPCTLCTDQAFEELFKPLGFSIESQWGTLTAS